MRFHRVAIAALLGVVAVEAFVAPSPATTTTTTTTMTSTMSTMSTASTATTIMSSSSSQRRKTHLAVSSSSSSPSSSSSSSSTTTTTTSSSMGDDDDDDEDVGLITWAEIGTMTFRDLQRHCEARDVSAEGTTAALRQRLRQLCQVSREECLIDVTTDTDYEELEVTAQDLAKVGLNFLDESDSPEVEFNKLMQEIRDKCWMGHWKTATRKLKKLHKLQERHRPRRRLDRGDTDTDAENDEMDGHGDDDDAFVIPYELYTTVLETCAENRLQGARASEPARKIMEEMVDAGYATLPAALANSCLQNCISGDGPNCTHDGFGGIDTALAMMNVLKLMTARQLRDDDDDDGDGDGDDGEGAAVVADATTTTTTAAAAATSTLLTEDTYGKLIVALANAGEWTDALSMLRAMIVDMNITPNLLIFANVASVAANAASATASKAAAAAAAEDAATATQEMGERVLTVLALAKAAGYELDNIASTVDGRELLAAGVVVAERMGNVALGLRLLTAAGKASGCAPDRGDDLVASSSAAAQRASTLLHKRAINRAVRDGEWKLSVKLLEVMMERSLRPSNYVWKNVVTCCAKAEKSRKSTALLLDWIKLAEKGKADTPPLSVFNTVVNACEICEEQDLTLMVLEAMKKTHDTDGNIITFNIALKRLAKMGNPLACEGIIIGMLQSGVEPSVVSYTTAIAACAAKKNPSYAYEWLKRMRSRNVAPNVVTYNTALAACLATPPPPPPSSSSSSSSPSSSSSSAMEDEQPSATPSSSAAPSLESTMLASKIAAEMMADVEQQFGIASSSPEEDGEGGGGDAAGSAKVTSSSSSTMGATSGMMTGVIPDLYTKTLARQLMKQLRENWRDGEIDMQVAKATLRVPLLKLVDFDKSEAANRARERQKKKDETTETGGGSMKKNARKEDEDTLEATQRDEMELEYKTVSSLHRTAEV